MMERKIHISSKDLLNQIQFKSKEMSDIALVSGQVHRVKFCLELLTEVKENFSTMGYTFWTGKYKGKSITVGNAGLYAPDTVLVTELLVETGINSFIRIGSCGALTENIQLSDLVIADRALRGDGVTKYYVKDDFIPASCEQLNDVLAKDIAVKGKKVHKGTVWTTDALLKETPEFVNPAIKQGAIAVDMVTSAFLTMCSLHKKTSAAVMVVSDNLITGEVDFTSGKVMESEKVMLISSLDAAVNFKKR